MRISDLSSDVCSADLRASRGTRGEQGIRRVSQRGSRADGGDTPRLTAWHLRRTLQAIGSRARRAPAGKSGRASCRERVCQYVSVSVVAVSLKKNKTQTGQQRIERETGLIGAEASSPR